MQQTCLARLPSVAAYRPVVALCVAVLLYLHGTAAVAFYPDRQIQLIVPYAAGGATDTVARILQQGMQQRLGQPVVVVNRAGGSTITGTQSVAHATPDGYTLVMVSVPHAANFTLYPEMPYAQSDFAPLAQVSNTANVLVVNPTLPVNSLSELIAYIKAHHGGINYGTFGVGSSAHLAGLLFASKIGEKLQAVHYRGGAPAAVGVMTGEIQFEFGTPLSVMPGIDAGKLKPLAVTAKQRLNILPNTPTMIEAGLDYVNGAWFGVLAPAGTPEPIIGKLADTIKATMTDPEVVKTMAASGTDVVATSPAEFTRFITDETTAWNHVLRGISIPKE
jgi:tripartite-type tricarboxylate transporter receptor subunit TctC